MARLKATSKIRANVHNLFPRSSSINNPKNQFTRVDAIMMNTNFGSPHEYNKRLAANKKRFCANLLHLKIRKYPINTNGKKRYMNTVLEKSIMKSPTQLVVTKIPINKLLAGHAYHFHSGCILQLLIGAVPADSYTYYLYIRFHPSA